LIFSSYTAVYTVYKNAQIQFSAKTDSRAGS
jgi:hypothetical protein